MSISRRGFFKGMGAVLAATGLPSLMGQKKASAETPDDVFKGQVGIEWLGHGSFLFRSCKGLKILLDPWVSTNPKCPGKYRKPGGFGQVHQILWTHGHVDHFMLEDAQSLIDRYQPKIIAPWELNFFIKSEIPGANCQTFALGNKGSTAEIDGIKITMVEAFHSAGAQLTGFEGTNRFVGEAVGYVLEFENGLKVYHAGDTSLMGDMKTIIGDFYQPHVAILPIGGVFTMGSDEAAYACKLIRPKIVIPEHYGTFPVLEQDCQRFKQQVAKVASGVTVHDIGPGQNLQL